MCLAHAKEWPSKMLNNTECFLVKNSAFCRATLYYNSATPSVQLNTEFLCEYNNQSDTFKCICCKYQIYYFCEENINK